jgi:PTH1 family peptidyl-tRNA hydrolase
MFLIVGLGNPGKHYENTRHNLGFMVIDRVCKELNAQFKEKALFWIAEVSHSNFDIVLLKPKTYMNLSGKAVSVVINEHELSLSNMLVICDDVNLPIGKIRIRSKGSDGGHKGLASVIQTLNFFRFPRLRVGIGAEFPNEKMVEYVLSSFTNSEIEIINKSIVLASQAVMSFITKGLIVTMNEYNGIS